MDEPESSPAYLEHCIEALLEALREAEALSSDGKVGAELSEVLRFAAELVDIIDKGLAGLPERPARWRSSRYSAITLRSTPGLLGSQQPLHYGVNAPFGSWGGAARIPTIAAPGTRFATPRSMCCAASVIATDKAKPSRVWASR